MLRPHENIVTMMRLNLLWYFPVGLAVMSFFVVPNFNSGYHNVALVFSRFSWVIFLSPAAYMFFSCVLWSVIMPFQLLLIIPSFFGADSGFYQRRYLWTIAVLVSLVAACVVQQVIIWGAFPLPADTNGIIRLRIIPFLPWPDSVDLYRTWTK